MKEKGRNDVKVSAVGKMVDLSMRLSRAVRFATISFHVPSKVSLFRGFPLLISNFEIFCDAARSFFSK